jgi:hypothetical protein
VGRQAAGRGPATASLWGSQGAPCAPYAPCGSARTRSRLDARLARSTRGGATTMCRGARGARPSCGKDARRLRKRSGTALERWDRPHALRLHRFRACQQSPRCRCQSIRVQSKARITEERVTWDERRVSPYRRDIEFWKARAGPAGRGTSSTVDVTLPRATHLRATVVATVVMM